MEDGEERGNNESLAAHDEHDFHGAPADHAKRLAAHAKRDGEFRHEDEAEDDNGRGRDVRGSLFEPNPLAEILGSHDVDGVLDRKGHAEADGSSDDSATRSDDNVTMEPADSSIVEDHPDLKDETRLDADDDGECKDEGGDAGAVLALWYSRKVVSPVRVELVELAGEVKALAGTADEIEEEGQRVEDEDGGVALLRFGSEKDAQEQDERGPNLRAVVDTCAHGVVDVRIDVRYSDMKGSVRCGHEGDVLGVGVEVRAWVGGSGSGHGGSCVF